MAITCAEYPSTGTGAINDPVRPQIAEDYTEVRPVSGGKHYVLLLARNPDTTGATWTGTPAQARSRWGRLFDEGKFRMR